MDRSLHHQGLPPAGRLGVHFPAWHRWWAAFGVFQLQGPLHQHPLAVSDIFNPASWRHLDSWEDVEACYIKDVDDPLQAPFWEIKNPVPSGWENPLGWEQDNPEYKYPKVWPKTVDFNDVQGSPICTAIDYPMVCLGALAGVLDIPGGLAAYNTVLDLLVDERTLYHANPTFALAPRP
jgi:hypothetical protein